MSRNLPTIPRVALILGLFMLVAHNLRLQPWTLDDAYITFRYAENLAAGHGAVFNPGERVEGYTSPLWMGILALVHALGAPTVQAAKALGFGLSAGILVLLATAWRLVPGVSPMSSAVAVLLTAACGLTTRWSMSGMEVPLVSFLSLAAVLVHLALRARPERTGLAALEGLLCALLVATRPDAALLPVALGLDALVGVIRGRVRMVSLLTLVGVALALYAPFFAYRWHWYGYPLPNTFYVKVGATGAQVWRGLDYLAQCGVIIWSLALAGLLGAALRWRSGGLAVAGWCLLHTAYVVSVGGDVFWGYRFYAALVPCLALMAGGLLAIEGAPKRLLGLGLALTIAHQLVWQYASIQLNYKGVVARRGVAVGRFLARNAPPEALLATNIAGSIPYYSRLRTIDTLGLNDLHIAHREVPDMGEGRAGHEKGDGVYVLEREPDIVIMGSSKGARKPWFRGDLELYQQADFQKEYELHLYEVGAARMVWAWVRRPEFGGTGLKVEPLATELDLLLDGDLADELMQFQE